MSCEIVNFSKIPVPMVEKTSGSKLTIGVNWADWLNGRAIDDVEWDFGAQGSPAELSGDDEATSGTTTTIQVSGGIVNKIYRIHAHVTADDGEEEDQYIDVAILI